MNYQFNMFSNILLISGFGTALMAALILKRKGSAVKWFSYLLLSIAIWALCYGMELSCQDLKLMVFWNSLEYIGIAFLPATWIIFILKYTGRNLWLNKSRLGAIFIVPFVTLIMVWTNKYHQFFYSENGLDTSFRFPLFKAEPGPWYIVHTVYFYALLALGIYFLFDNYKKADAIYKHQSMILFIAVIAPWIANILYHLRALPVDSIDITPFGFIITAFVICLGLLRYRLFDIAPFAREKVINSMQEGLLVLDAHLRVVDVNTEMKKMLSGRSSQVVGMVFSQLFPNQPNLVKSVNSMINDKIEIALKDNNETKYFEVSITQLFEKNYLYTGVILLFRDITEHRLAAEKLKKQADELIALNKLKDKLFSIISHDLRSPVSNLMKVLNMNDTGILSDDDLKIMLPVLSKNIGYVSGLLENLLYWSRTQMQGETINRINFNLHAIILDKLNLFEKQAEEKGISLINKINDQTTVSADKDMIDFVLRNLIGNAIKFCKNGDSITISAVIDASNTTICVADTGAGIKEENLRNLFKTTVFTTKGTMGEQGTGLGLVICKDFIEKNNGKIWVESKLGTGSNFYFTINNATPELAFPAMENETISDDYYLFK